MATRYVIGEAGARKLTALFNSGTLGPSGARKNGIAVEDGFEDPFTIRWAQSVNNGSWIIWIPDDHALLVNGTEIDVAEEAELEEAEGDYPEGWYVLGSSQSGSFILNVHIFEDASISPTCNIAQTADTPEEDERVIPICLASVSKNAATGVVKVKQYVKSSIVIDNTSLAQHLPPSPFRLEKTVVPPTEEGGEPTVVLTVVQNVFYWDGVRKTISDYQVPDGSTDVYLIATQDQEAATAAEPEWNFSISNTAPTPSASARAISYKLYSFASDGGVTDYRTTFMTIASPHKVRFFEVSPDGGSNSIKLDTTGQGAKIEATDGTNTVTINPSSLPQGSSSEFHTLTVHHEDGSDDDVYYVLSDSDIEITEGGSSSISLVGTDGSTATSTGSITFASASDSNVVVSVANGAEGNAVVTIGVYYK